MKIIPYSEKYRQAFIGFNTDWIVDNFGSLEQADVETFERVNDELAAGAMIFFAIDENGTALACCMARPMG